jgi:hypothetical protein
LKGWQALMDEVGTMELEDMEVIKLFSRAASIAIRQVKLEKGFRMKSMLIR